jgi:hypothetical protein
MTGGGANGDRLIDSLNVVAFVFEDHVELGVDRQ